MAGYWKLLGVYDAETTTFSELAYSGFTSPYSPVESAKLKGIRVIPGRAAVTTVINAVQFKLTCSTFKPNSIEVLLVGSGLQTAPAFQAQHVDFAVDQDVQAGVPITIEARNVGAYTAVSVEAFILGYFET